MKLIRKQQWASLVATGFLCLASSFMANSTCLDPKLTTAKEFAKTPLVVVGVATESQDVPDPEDTSSSIYTIYVVKVTQVFKGHVSKKPIWIFSDNTSARYPMDLGKPNLLFIWHDRGTYFVDNCGNSGPLDEQKKEFEQVKALASKGKPQPRNHARRRLQEPLFKGWM